MYVSLGWTKQWSIVEPSIILPFDNLHTWTSICCLIFPSLSLLVTSHSFAGEKWCQLSWLHLPREGRQVHREARPEPVKRLGGYGELYIIGWSTGWMISKYIDVYIYIVQLMMINLMKYHDLWITVYNNIMTYGEIPWFMKYW